MPYDYSKLLGRITEKYGTQARFAAAMQMSEHTLSLKVNAKRAWKQSEITAACELLGIPDSEVGAYFFALKVQSA